MSVVMALAHGSEVVPLEPQVGSVMDGLSVVDYLGEFGTVVPLAFIALAVGIESQVFPA
jgi:hypothetical protein